MSNELIICGRDEVFIWDLDKIENGIPAKTWSWKAADQTDLPDDYKGCFGSTDECKPFDGGNKILICSSGGAFAYVDRKENRTLFYGKGGNPHSADLLPGNRVAIALSTGGDLLAIYDLATSGQPPLLSFPFPSAHGVVWDTKREILWGLSYDELHAYRLKDWESTKPQLVLEKSIPLPDKDGHDFFPVPHTPYISVTTHAHCWLFDRDTKTFAPHPDLPSLVEVKSIDKHPVTGRIVYVKAIKGNQWWSENIRFLNPPADIHIPGEIFYKARWNA
jgi:hypothetical protein